MPSKLVLVCECLGWNWQNSVKTFKRKFYLKDEVYFPTSKYPYGFSDHLWHLFFTITFPNCSHYLATSFVTNRYRIYRFTKFWQLFFSFRKLWGCHTSPISWFINFNKLFIYLIELKTFHSLSLFKSRILKFIRSNPNSVFNCHDPKAIKYLSRIRLDLSHLREHKFKHSFQDTLIPICACGSDIETPCHYLISCPIFDAERNTLLNNIRQIAPSILNLNHSQITHVLLYGDSSLKNETNTGFLNSTMNYILNANLKISVYVHVHIKVVLWKFRVLNPRTSRVI